MVSNLRSGPRAHFKQRFKAAKSHRPPARASHGLTGLLLGRSPEDSHPETAEEATQWLESALGELEAKHPAKNG